MFFDHQSKTSKLIKRSTHGGVFCFLLPAIVIASPKPTTSNLYDTHLITVEHIPLPNFGKVSAIIRDDHGFLWFGTSRGLCKYDGHEVKVFRGATDGERYIREITKTRDGLLLLATWDGLLAFNLTTEQFVPLLTDADSPERMIIETLVQDLQGRIWMGTRSKGLIRYDPVTQEWKRYTKRDGLSEDWISGLLIDHTGVLWIGTYGGGLNSLDAKTGRITHYRSKPMVQATLWSDRIIALKENGPNELWIGTDEGLNVLNRKAGDVRRISAEYTQRLNISAIAQDPSGMLWIGTSATGVFTYVDGKLSPFTPSQGAPSANRFSDLSDNHIGAVYVDPTSEAGGRIILWVGTRSGGVNKVLLTKNPFTSTTRHHRSPFRGIGAILSICEDRNGVVWVGLWGGGLNALKRVNGNYRHIAHYLHDPNDPFSLPANVSSPIIEDRHGVLWIGSPDGLTAFDKGRKRFTTYRHDKNDSLSLAGNSINELYEDRAGRLWISTNSGLSQLIRDSGSQQGGYRFKNYFLRPEEPYPGRDPANLSLAKRTNDVKEDRSGNIWVATFGRGLNKLNAEGGFTQFFHPPDSLGDRENWIYDLVEDEEGIFWLSTAVGLVSFDPKSGTFRTHSLGQFDEAHISDIVVGQNGNLWLSIGVGLIRFNSKSGSILRFDETHGFPFRELISEFSRNKSGKLFVGALDGFTEFFPESVYTPTTPPPVVITGFSVFDEAMPAAAFAGEEIVLAHDQNFFSFSFAALDYVDPKNNRHAYRMVGVDPDWVKTGNRNYASYTDLDPGEYLFQAKGANRDDVWNEEGVSIRVIVTPAWWQTSWFRIGVGVALVSLLVLAYNYRVSQLLQVERMRVRIATDLHDDIGSRLSSIALMSDVARSKLQKGDQEGTALSKISTIARETANVLKDLVWAIDPECDKLGDILQRMRDVATEQLGDVVQSFHFPFDGSDIALDLNTRRNLLLLYKEALHNIQKHAKASMVWIDGRLEQNTFQLEIRDNGLGFNSEVGHKGRGLNTMRQRAQNIGATLNIVSEPSRGTTLVLSMKIPRTRYASHA